jgi:outer membrane protein assembly factor BamB
MGFLKNLFKIFSLVILIFGCTRTIHFYNYNEDASRISQFGNNPNRNFYYKQKISIDKKPFWDRSIYGSFSKSSFVAYDSILFAADLGGRITAINIKNGKKNGEIKYKGSIEQAPIVNENKLIFVLNIAKDKNSELIVYDFINGKEVENSKLAGKVTNELIFENANIFVLSDFGILYKFNKNGVIIWEKDLHANFFSDPASDGENLYAASLDGNLFSVKLNSGEINYKKKIAAGFQSGICLNEMYIFIGDEEGNMISVNKNNGEVNWKYETKFIIRSIPAFDNKFVYFGNLNGDLFSLELNSGKLNWSLQTDGLINTTSLVFENVLIQPNLKKQVDIVNKLDGKIVESIPFDGRCRTTPFFYNNKIFFGIDKDDVYCFSLNIVD